MKKITILLCLLFLSSSGLFARNIGLNIDIGAQYNNHQLHEFQTGANGFNVHRILSKHMGGFHLDISYVLGKNWSIFLDTAFSFNKTFVNDSLLGFGYTFPVKRYFDIFFGLGFGFGGSLFSYKLAATSVSDTAAYIGAGFELKGLLMFSDHVGFYFGVQDNMYAAVSGKHKTVTGNVKTEVSRSKSDLPDMVNSLLLKAGLRIAL